jgi:hypothetical protein
MIGPMAQAVNATVTLPTSPPSSKCAPTASRPAMRLVNEVNIAALVRIGGPPGRTAHGAELDSSRPQPIELRPVPRYLAIAVLGRENPSASGQCAAVTSTPRTIRFGEASVYVQGASLKTGAAP